MGRGYTQYRLPESGREERVLFSVFINYRFPDGSRLPVLQDAAWCPNCDRFVVAEEIPSIESLRLELEKARSDDPETIQIWQFVSDGQPISVRVAELEKRIVWRIARVNPGRCLECGSLDIVALPGGTEFRHPKTGELVTKVSSGWTDAGPWSASFTPEGDAMDEQDVEPQPPTVRF